MTNSNGWIGVDLDGTLAEYDQWRGIEHIGAPIMPMVNRVKQWIAEGQNVRIFTARCDGQTAIDPRAENVSEVIAHIQAWCLQHIGQILPVTNIKDYGMIQLWDDRAVQVISNTGEPVISLPQKPVSDTQNFLPCNDDTQKVIVALEAAIEEYTQGEYTNGYVDEADRIAIAEKVIAALPIHQHVQSQLFRIDPDGSKHIVECENCERNEIKFNIVYTEMDRQLAFMEKNYPGLSRKLKREYEASKLKAN